MLNSNDINYSVSAACLYKMCDDRRVKCYKCIFVILELVLIVKSPALYPASGCGILNLNQAIQSLDSQEKEMRDVRQLSRVLE